MKKTAEEILDKYQSDREYPNYYHESKVIEAMEEYASQFQPQWIKGLPPEDFGICLLNTIDQGVVTGHTQTMKDNFKQENVTHYSACPIIQPPKGD